MEIGARRGYHGTVTVRTSLRASLLPAGLLLALAPACGRTQMGLPGSGMPPSTTSGTDGTTGTTGPTSTTSTTSTTTGPPPECIIHEDCFQDVCTEGRCVDGTCVFSPLDLDDDTFPPEFCGGSDCNDLNPNTNPAQPEDCFDGDDNDCNGVADCFDPACLDVPGCGCTPAPGGENCTNGIDDDCDTTVDCLDTDCLGMPVCGCLPSETGLACVNGFDDDCDGLLDCDDPDCAATQACQCQGQIELCDNGTDDDCDLLVDCADPDCEGLFPCTCGGVPAPEVCDNGFDDDCDGAVDCMDTDCTLAPACQTCTQEACDNGADDDCDGKIDCADDACTFAPNCAPTPEVCNNGLDDDGDGLVDCLDPDCANVPVCDEKQATCDTAKLITESGSYFGDTTGNPNLNEGTCGGGAGEAVFYFILNEPMGVRMDSIGTSFDSVLYVRRGSCPDGFEVACDDDSAGNQWAAKLEFPLLQPGTYFVFLDGYTIDPNFGPNEGPFQFNIEFVTDPFEICDNMIDDDGDVYADCADPDCTFAPGCAGCNNGADPEPEFGTARCTDGIDNDCDGAIDCSDDDCTASDFYVTECCNGQDQNGNGIPDDFNCRCNNDSECDQGQICYTHTANACGFPCTDFFGDVCPFVAAGSFCNQATQQCEFPP